MNGQKRFAVGLAIVVLFCFIARPGGSQSNSGEVLSFSGVVERIQDNFKFIVVNEAIVLLSSETVICDEKGNTLRTTDLKPRWPVAVHAVRKPEGWLAQKIVVTFFGSP